MIHWADVILSAIASGCTVWLIQEIRWIRRYNKMESKLEIELKRGKLR